MRGYLSHYTNVESLEKILENQSIKFNAFKNLNDEYEGRNKEGFKVENMMYCSSWCNDKTESGIPYMWRKYSNKENTTIGCGVRISLPRSPFKKYKDIFSTYVDNSDNLVFIPPELQRLYVDFSGKFNPFLRKIKYTNDKKKYMPSVFSVIDNYENININKLGFYKERKEWEKEKEWRYVVIIFHRESLKFTPKTINNSLDKYPSEVYLTIATNLIKHMRVLMEENITNDNFEKVLELQKKYGFKILNK